MRKKSGILEVHRLHYLVTASLFIVSKCSKTVEQEQSVGRKKEFTGEGTARLSHESGEQQPTLGEQVIFIGCVMAQGQIPSSRRNFPVLGRIGPPGQAHQKGVCA